MRRIEFVGRERFEEFAGSASTRLLRAAYLLVGDRGIAEDLTQDVLARVFVAWPRVTGDPYAYAYRALVNAAANRRRWASRHPEVLVPETVHVAVGVDPADSVVAQDELMAALGQLTARQRAVVVLRYFLDLTEADTARLLDVNIGTVKSQHARAVTHLREILHEEVMGAGDGSYALPESDGSTS